MCLWDSNSQQFMLRERAIIQTQIFDKLAMAASSSAAVGSISSFSALSPSPSPSSSCVATGLPIPRRCPNGHPSLQSSFICRTTHSSFLSGGDAAAALAVVHVDGNGHAGGALGSQMNIFERAVRVVKSYANALISSTEDPEKLLDQTVLEMNEDLTKLRQASAQVLASQRQLENKYKAGQQTADDWYRRAKLALEKGEENLAREALKRRKDYEDSAKALKIQLEQQTSVVEKLISNTRLLESKIQEAKSKKDTLKARAQSAKTSQKVNEMLGNINTSSALAAFDKMEEKVNALEAEADSLNQLSTDDLAGKFALLETGGSVDDDFAALKKEMVGSSKKAGELPPGRTPASNVAYPFQDMEVERELNELRRKTMGS